MPSADYDAGLEPTEPGWYTFAQGAQTMIFHLREYDESTMYVLGRKDPLQWSVHLDNGTAADCGWRYIEQMLRAFDLVRLVPETRVVTPPGEPHG